MCQKGTVSPHIKNSPLYSDFQRINVITAKIACYSLCGNAAMRRNNLKTIHKNMKKRCNRLKMLSLYLDIVKIDQNAVCLNMPK